MIKASLTAHFGGEIGKDKECSKKRIGNCFSMVEKREKVFSKLEVNETPAGVPVDLTCSTVQLLV